MGASRPARHTSGSPTRASPCTTRSTPLQATTNRSTTGSLDPPTLPSTPPQWPRRIAFWSTISRLKRRHGYSIHDVLSGGYGGPGCENGRRSRGRGGGDGGDQRTHRRRPRSQRNLHARVGSWGLDSDTSRLRRSRGSVARSDAAVHHESGERPTPGPSQGLKQRTLEPGLQPDSKLRRNEQHGSIRGGNRDRSLLDGTHRETI